MKGQTAVTSTWQVSLTHLSATFGIWNFPSPRELVLWGVWGFHITRSECRCKTWSEGIVQSGGERETGKVSRTCINNLRVAVPSLLIDSIDKTKLSSDRFTWMTTAADKREVVISIRPNWNWFSNLILRNFPSNYACSFFSMIGRSLQIDQSNFRMSCAFRR